MVRALTLRRLTARLVVTVPFAALLATVCVPSAHAGTGAPSLGTAQSFAVLAGSKVTNTGPTTIQGNLGVSPGSAVTGFPPGIVSGEIHAADDVALQAQADLTTAYDDLAGRPCPPDHDLSGTDLGGLTLTPGVYCFSSSAQLTGALTLDAQGISDAVFIFQIGSALTTAPSSSVLLTNGGQDDGVFWQVGSSATLDTTTTFKGSILALTSITLNTGANIHCGRALARNGAVTLDTNDINIFSSGCVCPP
jgi:hypothetical protein